MSGSPHEHAKRERWDMEDMVNSPPHHKAGGIEAIDVIKAKLTPEQYQGYLLGNSIKYQLRCNHKGAFKEDISKSQWYINRLLDEQS